MIEPLLARALASRPLKAFLRRMMLLALGCAAALAGLGFLIGALFLALARVMPGVDAALVAGGMLLTLALIAFLLAALIGRSAASQPLPAWRDYVRRRPAESLAAAVLAGIMAEWVGEDPPPETKP